jgi:hypothetical protein
MMQWIRHAPCRINVKLGKHLFWRRTYNRSSVQSAHKVNHESMFMTSYTA